MGVGVGGERDKTHPQTEGIPTQSGTHVDSAAHAVVFIVNKLICIFIQLFKTSVSSLLCETLIVFISKECMLQNLILFFSTQI